MHHRGLTAIALLTALQIMPAAAQNENVSDAQVARIRARVQAKLDSLHAGARFPGMTFGAAFANGKTIGLATGWADTARKERMNASHRMPQGSVGKTYHAAVALQLVDEGKLELDAPISRYLSREPWWRDATARTRLPNGDQITVRQLMNHTSGVVRYEFNPKFLQDLTANPLKVWTPAERIAYVLDRAPPFAAGQGWEYSDTNYIILALIIERITGNTLYTELDRRILKRFDLRNTIPSDQLRLAGVSQGYAGPNNPFGGFDAMIENGAFRVNPQLEWAGGGVASTAEDLARWARLTWESNAFSHDLLHQVVQGVEARQLGAGAKYGLGVILRSTPIGDSQGHSGFFPGYLTEVRYYPDHRFAVAAQVNTSVGQSLGRGLGGILQELAAIVHSELNRSETPLEANAQATFP
jgi:D-alanyl-D-alanine carboxypeptidase